MRKFKLPDTVEALDDLIEAAQLKVVALKKERIQVAKEKAAATVSSAKAGMVVIVMSRLPDNMLAATHPKRTAAWLAHDLRPGDTLKITHVQPRKEIIWARLGDKTYRFSSWQELNAIGVFDDEFTGQVAFAVRGKQ
jgi:hypothetical protein